MRVCINHCTLQRVQQSVAEMTKTFFLSTPPRVLSTPPRVLSTPPRELEHKEKDGAPTAKQLEHLPPRSVCTVTPHPQSAGDADIPHSSGPPTTLSSFADCTAQASEYRPLFTSSRRTCLSQTSVTRGKSNEELPRAKVPTWGFRFGVFARCFDFRCENTRSVERESGVMQSHYATRAKLE